MKASIEWLKEFSDINISTNQLSEILTMTGSKVEDIEESGNDIRNVVVGKILTIEKHPDADKLVITKVDVGNEKLQIVTGASNIKEGDIVPIAKNGSELPGGIHIKTGKLRGIESCGMMCSIGELGLSIEDYPEQIEDGIMILPKKYEKNLGEDIVKILKLKEEIIDFEITSNRPDCLSIEGIGREVAVSLNEKFKNPRANIDSKKEESKSELEGLKVDILAPELCYRYIARAVKNVKIGPSPDWMKQRLKACGMRPINNIVDITNYVMLEMGQPMHAFDITSISGGHIIVRRALDGEKITTLDEQQRTLNKENLVIADEKKAIAIAGVMGGLNSEIENNTNTVIFESAVFNGSNIRLTAKQVGLRTEASSRYEKGLSPENALRAINRAVELVNILEAGEEISGVIDVYPTKQKENKIEFIPERINALLGTELSKNEMEEILNKLNIKIQDGFAIPPYYRMDIEGEADLAEEILRIYGYDKLGSTLICAETTLGGKNKQQKLEDTLKNLLVDKGFSEIYTYSLLNEKELIKSKIDREKVEQSIILKNPLNEDYNRMRVSTIPSIMQTISLNFAKKNQNVNLFEIGRIYLNKNKNIEKNILPIEETILSLASYGEHMDFYTLKGIVENIMEASHIKRYELSSNIEKESYHPGRVAKISVGNDTIAIFGEIHPIVANNYGVGTRVYMAEIYLEKLAIYGRANNKYTEIAKFPAIQRDIAIVVDEEIEVGTIEKIIAKKSKNILENIKLFDIYRSEKIGNGKKGVAYSLRFRSNEKTLSDEEIAKVMENIILELKKEVGADLRK